MMKQNYNNKAKYRSAWFALVLLMITALPISAQNKRERFEFDSYWYEVVDAAKHTVKVTYKNEKAATADARGVDLKSDKDKLPNANEWKAYSGNPKQDEVDEPKKGYNEKATHKIKVINIPEKVSHNGKEWTVVAIGAYAFINERGIYKVELPETIEAIEDAAFYQCSVITLKFPEKLKYIGWRAFYKTNLDPYEMTKVPDKKGKFRRWKEDRGIAIPGKTAIGPQAFEGSFSKAKFSCPNITFVGYQAFKGAKFDITTPIPATAKIGEPTTDATIKAMYNNLDPAVTDYRSGVESFAEYSFDLSSFTDWQKTTVFHTLEEGPTTIPAGMFEKAFTEKDNFFIPLSVTTIEERAFANAGIKSFNDLSKVKKIGARAFENGVLSGDFVLEQQVEEVGDGAFKGNVNLAGFTLIGSANCKVGVCILEGCPLEYLDMRNVKSTYVKNHLTNLSREANSSTITKGLPTHTIVYLPDVPTISFADGQDVNFVKSNGECTKLLLEDGTEYEFPYEIKASEVVYNRDFSDFASGKNCFTIFLPYAVTLPQGIRAYYLDLQTERSTGKINEYTGNYIMEEVYMFNSIPDGSKLEANRPYLLRITDNKNHTSQEFKAIDNTVVIAASGNDKDKRFNRLKPKFFTEGKNDQSYVFTGSTEKLQRGDGQDTSANNPWTLGRDENGNDMWKRMPGKTGVDKLIPPFRGIIMPKSTIAAANQFVLLTEEDNQTAGINDVTGNTDVQQGAQRIYTIDGRYVGTNFDSLPSGMYIMKGKKTLKTK